MLQYSQSGAENYGRPKSFNTLSCFHNGVTVERFGVGNLVGIMLYVRIRITYLPYTSVSSQEYVLVSR